MSDTPMSGEPDMMSYLREQFARIDTQFERIDARFDRLSADLMERMDRLQNRMVILDDHLTMNLGNSDRVERRSASLAEENRLLGEQLISLTKLLRHLEGRVNALEERQ